MAVKPTTAQIVAMRRALDQLDDVPPRLRADERRLDESGQGAGVNRVRTRLRASELRARAATQDLTAAIKASAT